FDERTLHRFDVRTLPSAARAAALERNAVDKRARILAIPSSTDEERQQAATDVEVARANYRQALLEAEAGLAAPRQRRAALAAAEQRLRDTRVVAPVPQREDGDPECPPEGFRYLVAQRPVNKGETVRPGFATPLVKLVLDHTLKLQAQLPERYLPAVRE